MAKDIFIPKLGQTVEEVTLVNWLVEDGDTVEKGQEILEVETDKAVFSVEATAKGTVHKGPYEAGQVVPVLTVVGIIGKPDEKFEAAEAGSVPEAETLEPPDAGPAPAETPLQEFEADEPPEPSGVRQFASPRARKLAAEKSVDLRRVTPTGGGGARVAERDVVAYLSQLPKASPLAQKLAAEAGVNLAGITGTGQGGRITRGDVERAMEGAAVPEPAEEVVTRPAVEPMPATAVESAELLAGDVPEITKRVPLTGVRKIIAERMGDSVHTTARVTLVMEVDATEFVGMRERLKATVSEAWGFTPGYNDLLAKIVAAALREYPYMNARLTPDAIEHLGHINMGMAVDTDRGLLVPVIRDADRKSLRQFGKEFRELVERARAGRSLPDDLSGGTFTITNLGTHDVDAFTPVINMPEAAILGVGRIAPKWVFSPDQPDRPVLRQMWTLSLVFDHRVVDGAPAARFLQYIKNIVEEPYLLLAA
jgi:pyruvate dehydrogenase E2 component (dihydrolipoamide acetyltransferase)